MAALSLIDFEIFPSQYSQNGSGEKCCWLGGRPGSNKNRITLETYQTDAIAGHQNPEWGFHLLSTGNSDEYRLKYVKMSEPLKEWFGVVLEAGKLVLHEYKDGDIFTVKKLGAYYTLQASGGYVECESGSTGQATDIQIWNSTPPTAAQVATYSDIPEESFRLLWKFVKLAHMAGRNWISKIDPSRIHQTIDRLFIPGTHDSGTEQNTQFNQTQFHTTAEQSAMGVRYFDLRVAKDWQLYHGSNSTITLKEVVRALVDHIDSHPSEFFILQITPEDAASFSTRLYAYLCTVDTHFFDKYAYLGSAMPSIHAAKGKIIFFARGYQPMQHGMPQFQFEQAVEWKDNTEGSHATTKPFPAAGLRMYVQDCYSGAGDSYKFDSCITPTLDKMFKADTSHWYINFTSVANKYPIDSAARINPWVANQLMWTESAPAGVLAIDDARPGSIANIIALNY